MLIISRFNQENLDKNEDFALDNIPKKLKSGHKHFLKLIIRR